MNGREVATAGLLDVPRKSLWTAAVTLKIEIDRSICECERHAIRLELRRRALGQPHEHRRAARKRTPEQRKCRRYEAARG